MEASPRKLFVPLDGTERAALAKLAECERRDPRAQAAFLIREALERAGLLSPMSEVINGS